MEEARVVRVAVGEEGNCGDEGGNERRPGLAGILDG